MITKNAVITGGEGFIGSHLIKRLLSDDRYTVTILGNFKRNSLKLLDIPKSQYSRICDIIKCDIVNDENTLNYVMKNANIVVHAAAICGVSNYINHPEETIVTNGVGTYNVLKACKNSKSLSRVVVLSSSEVYGESAFSCIEDRYVEIDAPKNLRLTYAVGKLFGDHYAIALNRQSNLPIVVVRPFGIYGPAQTGEGAIQIFVRKAINNETIPVVGTGNQTRDWCYIDDAIDFLVKCIENDKVNGEVLNMGNPSTDCSIVELAKMVIQLSESKSKIEFVKRSEVKDTLHRKSNIDKATRLIGFCPKYSLEEGIKKTIEWYREHNSVGEDACLKNT